MSWEGLAILRNGAPALIQGMAMIKDGSSVLLSILLAQLRIALSADKVMYPALTLSGVTPGKVSEIRLIWNMP